MYKLRLDGKVHSTGHTVKDAYNSGWCDGDIAWTRGYKSRINQKEDKIKVYEAGGKRKGWIFYEVPCWKSTRYHYRCYMYKRVNPDVLTIN